MASDKITKSLLPRIDQRSKWQWALDKEACRESDCEFVSSGYYSCWFVLVKRLSLLSITSFDKCAMHKAIFQSLTITFAINWKIIQYFLEIFYDLLSKYLWISVAGCEFSTRGCCLKKNPYFFNPRTYACVWS